MNSISLATILLASSATPFVREHTLVREPKQTEMKQPTEIPQPPLLVVEANTAYVMSPFEQGIIAGGMSALLVDYLRSNILPDATRLNLYGKYGICRDQLAGQVKIVSALAALSLHEGHYNPEASIGWKTALVRSAGAIVGVNIAAYLRKLISR